jgi:phenylacetic acid degradation operon negative regulatory protein
MKPAIRATRFVEGLLQRFSRRRPLRAGSLIVSVFGDSIASRRSEVALAGLLDLLVPFGITERLARTSIGRLAQEDWLQSRRAGRASFYRLTPSGAERFAEATERIYAAPKRDWSGEWTVVLLPNANGGAERDSVRRELSWMGFGQCSPSSFTHPDSAAQEVERHLKRLKLEPPAVVLQTRGTSLDADRRLVELGWDLRDLERRYRQFIRTFEPALEALPSGGSLVPRDCFHLRTLLIHEYRRVHLRDPSLPATLLPAGWVGTAAYALCRRLYQRLAADSDAYVSRMLRGPRGALPAVPAGAANRFR